MNLRSFFSLVPAVAIAAAMTACGGRPDIDKVKADFENPSGSVSDKTGMAGASGGQEASKGALGLAGSGVPGGTGLMAESSKGVGRLSPISLFGDRVRAAHRALGTSRSVQGLRSAEDYSPTSGCDGAESLTSAYNQALADLVTDASGGGSSASASADFELDVATCSGGAVTGTMKGSIELEVVAEGEDSGKFFMRFDQSYVDVCETEGDKNCINGEAFMEAEGAFNGTGAGSLSFTTAVDVTIKNSMLETHVKSGVRLVIDSTQQGAGQFKIEYLVYAKSSAGDEVSYVLTIEASEADGTVRVSVRGTDGNAECTFTADGGSCTGDSGALEWSEAEEDSALESEG